MKINEDYMKNTFDLMANEYKEAAKNIGLWKSERYVIDKYLKSSSGKILDMGCGSGRITFGLVRLGYRNIVGIDFSQKMIEAAKTIASIEEKKIFKVGNCLDIKYPSNYFDYVIFSFNGLMQIPKQEQRLKALTELYRVLKEKGILFFTTHDRAFDLEDFGAFWKEEEKKWSNGLNNPLLHDFGDIISHTDDTDIEYFIHIPDYDEIAEMIRRTGFNLIETFERDSFFTENENVKEFSTNCRFWIVQK